MKLIFLSLFISLYAFASVTPEQFRAIQKESIGVMMDLGADPDLNPRVTSVKVLSTLGSRVKVKFSYIENLYGKKNCTFYYDLETEAAVPRSALCGL